MSGGPLEPTDLDHRLRAAETIVREAGRVAADQFVRRELLSIDRKGAQDLVSEADASAKTSLWLVYSSCSPRMASSAKSAVRAIRRRPQSGWSTQTCGTWRPTGRPLPQPRRIGSAMRIAFGFQGLFSGCLAGSTGSRAFGPATPGILCYSLGNRHHRLS